METLTAYFATSPAGPLALCAAIYADNEPLEFLGGLFDPVRRDIGIAHGTLSRFERLLGELEEADQWHQAMVFAEHRHHIQQNSTYERIDPFVGDHPVAIWQLLKDIRAGMPYLDNEGPEIRAMLESTAMIVDQRGNTYTSSLHHNLFAPKWTRLGAAIRAILNRAAHKTGTSQ